MKILNHSAGDSLSVISAVVRSALALSVAVAAAGCGGVARDVSQEAQGAFHSVYNPSTQWLSLAQGWLPPAANAGDTAYLPGQAGNYSFQSSASNPNSSSVQLNIGGIHGTYIGGNGGYDVYSRGASLEDAEAVFKNAIASARAVSGGQIRIDGPATYKFEPDWEKLHPYPRGIVLYRAMHESVVFGSPAQSIALWWEYGRLIGVTASGSDQADDFLQNYLNSINDKGASSGYGAGILNEVKKHL